MFCNQQDEPIKVEILVDGHKPCSFADYLLVCDVLGPPNITMSDGSPGWSHPITFRNRRWWAKIDGLPGMEGGYDNTAKGHD